MNVEGTIDLLPKTATQVSEEVAVAEEVAVPEEMAATERVAVTEEVAAAEGVVGLAERTEEMTRTAQRETEEMTRDREEEDEKDFEWLPSTITSGTELLEFTPYYKQPSSSQVPLSYASNLQSEVEQESRPSMIFGHDSWDDKTGQKRDGLSTTSVDHRPGPSPSRRQSLSAIFLNLRQNHAEVRDMTFDLNRERALVRHHRQDFVQSITSFFDKLRPFLQGIETSARLEEEFQTLCGHRLTALETLEDNYGKLEDDLIQRQVEVERWEERLFDAGPDIKPIEALGPVSSRAATSEDRVDASSTAADQSPELEQYLSRLGDVDLLKERLMDLRSERAQLVEEQRKRARFGLSLDEHSLEFLRNFDALHQHTMDEYTAAQTELDQLKQALPDQDDSVGSQKAEVESLAEDVEGAQGTGMSEDSADKVDPIIATDIKELFRKSSSEEPVRVFEGHVPGGDQSPIDPADFINAWLLSRLRRSTRERRIFVSCVNSKVLPHNPAHLENLILDTWFSDGTKDRFAIFRNAADQQSMLTNLANSRQFISKSDDTFLRRRPLDISLLRISPNIDSTNIIAHARRLRVRSLSRGAEGRGNHLSQEFASRA